MDGTSRVVSPLTFLEKLAALIQPLRVHQVTYHGVLAPAAAIRPRVVPGPPAARRCRGAAGSSAPARRYPWAELLKRVFAVDALSCHRCGGRREVLALITEGSVVRAILECLGLPTEGPAVHPARGPPELF